MTKNQTGPLNDNYRHGEANRTPEYDVWLHIKSRCYNTRNKDYRHYGKRGIQLHPTWRADYVTFISDIQREIGRRPSSGHTLDRIDNDGHYEPGNVRWATRREQARNVRRNVVLTLNGEAKTIAEWADLLKMPRPTLYSRIRAGFSPQDALTKSERELRCANG